MAIEFMGSNAIVLAPQTLNPAIFTQAWMIEHLQVRPPDFVTEGTLQVPMLFSSSTTCFHILVMQDRIQLSPSLQRRDDWEEEGAMVRRVMERVVGTFQNVQYTAIGLNFSWAVHSGELPNSETSRRLFFTGDSPLFRLVDAPDACFGAYVSKNLLGFRLRVDAKPIAEQGDQPEAKRVLFSFNFHQDLSGDGRVPHMNELLSRWNEAKTEAYHILEMVNLECGL